MVGCEKQLKSLINAVFNELKIDEIEHAKEVGIEKERINVALDMLKDNMPLEIISKYTKLSIAKIEEIKNNDYNMK
jgi:hypothetical protein